MRLSSWRLSRSNLTFFRWSGASNSQKRPRRASSLLWCSSCQMSSVRNAKTAQTSISAETISWTKNTRVKQPTVKSKKKWSETGLAKTRLAITRWTNSTSRRDSLTWLTEDSFHIKCRIWSASNARWWRTQSSASTASAPEPTSRLKVTRPQKSLGTRTFLTRTLTLACSCRLWETSPLTTRWVCWPIPQNKLFKSFEANDKWINWFRKDLKLFNAL